MFELKYDILDDLDALQSNCVMRAIDASDIKPERKSVAQFYDELTKSECSHLLVLAMQWEKTIDFDSIRENFYAVVHRFFPDVPDVYLSYSPSIPADWTNVLTHSTFDHFVEAEKTHEHIDYEKRLNPYSVVFKIPIKLPFCCNKHLVKKMLNFICSTYGVYYKYRRMTRFTPLLLYAFNEDGPYMPAKRIEDMTTLVYKAKFGQSFHLQDQKDMFTITSAMCYFFDDKECCAAASQEWFNKYAPSHLNDKILSYEELSTIYYNTIRFEKAMAEQDFRKFINYCKYK